MGVPAAVYYRARAAEMQALAQGAQTEALRKSFLRLEASWTRLAEQAEKTPPPEPPPEQEDDGRSSE